MASFGLSNSYSSSSTNILELYYSTFDFNKAFAQLASGSRLNSAADDAAGLAIASQLESNIATISQASRDASDALSALTVADAALGQVQDITNRLQELALTAANGVYGDEQRSVIQEEYAALTAEIQRIGDTTNYNGTKLLDGSSLTIISGESASALVVKGLDLTALSTSLTSQNLSTQAGATSALTVIQDFSDQVLGHRTASIGTAMSRLDSIQAGFASQREIQAQALSIISDADIGSASSQVMRNKVIQVYQTTLLTRYTSLQTSLFKSLFA